MSLQIVVLARTKIGPERATTIRGLGSGRSVFLRTLDKGEAQGPDTDLGQQMTLHTPMLRTLR
jgi:hypothetical protein